MKNWSELSGREFDCIIRQIDTIHCVQESNIQELIDKKLLNKCIFKEKILFCQSRVF